MNSSINRMRWMAFLLSTACLLVMSGCQGRQTTYSSNEEIQNLSSISVVTSGNTSALSSTTTIPSSDTAAAVSETSDHEEDRSSVTTPNEPSQSSASTAESVVSFSLGESPTDRFLSNNTNPNPNRSFYAQIVRSVEELQSLYHEEGFREERPGFTSKYNEQFFEKNAIVYFTQYLPSVSDQIQVNSLIRNHDQLTVDYTIEKAVFADGATAIGYELLEVNKSDVDGVVDIVPQQHEAQLGE